MLHVMQHIVICLLLKFHKILMFIMKVIRKKLRGSANYGLPCISKAKQPPESDFLALPSASYETL